MVGSVFKLIAAPFLAIGIIAVVLWYIFSGIMANNTKYKPLTPEQMYHIVADNESREVTFVDYDTLDYELDYRYLTSRFEMLDRDEKKECQTEILAADKRICEALRFIDDTWPEYYTFVKKPKKIPKYFSDQEHYEKLVQDLEKAQQYNQTRLGVSLEYKLNREYTWAYFSDDGCANQCKIRLEGLIEMLNAIKGYYEKGTTGTERRYHTIRITTGYSRLQSTELEIQMSRLRMLKKVKLPYTPY